MIQGGPNGPHRAGLQMQQLVGEYFSITLIIVVVAAVAIVIEYFSITLIIIVVVVDD